MWVLEIEGKSSEINWNSGMNNHLGKEKECWHIKETERKKSHQNFGKSSKSEKEILDVNDRQRYNMT